MGYVIALACHPSPLMNLRILICCVALVESCLNARASVLYGIPGNSYSQDFDSLGSSGSTWTNDSTLQGWYYALSTGAAPTSYNAANGSSPAQDLALSVGSSGSGERGLGSQNPGTANTKLRFGLQLNNDSADTLSQFTLSYTGEEWRVIANEATQDKLVFEYQIFASGSGNQLTTTTGWTSVSALTFTAPIAAGASAALDGNASANRIQLSSPVTGITWAPGQELWLRWTDSTVGASGTTAQLYMMGVDDLSFVATPEPSTAGIFLAGSLLLGAFRSRQRGFQV